jgi:acetate kinase
MAQYIFEMGGVDAIVMTAGVGENSVEMRKRILKNLEGRGVVIDAERNEQHGEHFITTDFSPIKVIVIPTNEELVIARDVVSLID